MSRSDYIPDWSDFDDDPRRGPYDDPKEDELRDQEIAMERRAGK